MASNAAKLIAHLRKTDFKHWTTSLWMVKRRLIAQAAHYSVLRVDVDKKLQNRLKKAVTDRIQGSDYKLEEYDFLTADQDGHVFTIDSSGTDFAQIQAEVDKGLQNKKAEKYEDLLDSWAYVLKLENDGNVIYSVRKINKLTRAAKVKSVSYLLFHDKRLTDLTDESVLMFDMQIDFFSYQGTTFITNKKGFESALNFRQGMEKNRDALLHELMGLKIFSDVEPIRIGVGVNLHFLRKVSAIQKSGYYKDKDFLRNLIRLNEEKGWGLTVENGVIVPGDGNIELVLKLLNNDRLESPINQEMFDATVKKKVR